MSLTITQSVGPRILALQLGDGPNLFAELPHFTIPCPDAGLLTLWGGHRLWHAPEVSRRTYLPDEQPVSMTATADGVHIVQPTEALTGLQKSITVRLPDDTATVIVDHGLTNHGLWPVTCAPWAITQMRPGGTAVLPQPTAPADPDGLQPNRSLVLWQYTDMNSPYIQWGNEVIRITAAMTDGALKIGFPNPRGWLAYHWQDMLFVKQARFAAQATYLDRNSSSQCYCNDQFLELETLGPEMTIAPGATVLHREVWQVYKDVALGETETAVIDLISALNLDTPSPYL
ncbi:MAG: hypothetical protein R3E31_27730 [Chloroflexota bacterium]